MNTSAEMQLPTGWVSMTSHEQAAIVGGLGPLLFLAAVVLGATALIVTVAVVAAVVGGVTYAVTH